MRLLTPFCFHCQTQVRLHNSTTFKASAPRIADVDTESCFPSTQVSTTWCRNPRWCCFHNAGVGHLPLGDHEPSPARQFIHPSVHPRLSAPPRQMRDLLTPTITTSGKQLGKRSRDSLSAAQGHRYSHQMPQQNGLAPL